MDVPAAAPAALRSDPNYPEPPPDAVVLQEGEWHDFDTMELLRRVAMANCANRTGELDWNEGAAPLGRGLVAISQGYCDNFLLRCLVPKYQIKVKDGKDGRSQEYALFGRRCAKVREILRRQTRVAKSCSSEIRSLASRRTAGLPAAPA